MNKKAIGGNKIMIFPFLLVLIIILGGLVLGVWLFFGSEIDFRQIDTDLLNNKIQSCLSKNTIDWQKQNDFYEKCKINQESLQQNLLILITQSDKTLLTTGKIDPTQCFLGEKNKNYPVCTKSSFNDLIILTGSNQKANKQLG
jgi:hypothetical protein